MIKKTQQSGFTLFQMAFLVAAVGVIVGALFANWNTAQGTNALVVTQERQSRIAIALSDYLQTYGRLPCPGNLAGDLQSAGREVGPPCAAQEGILPYRTLGLNPLDVYDGWGNLFTYAVQVDIRGNNLGVAGNVYDQCRRSAGQSPWVPVATNMNPIKANICCRSVLNANRLRVLDAAAVPNDLVPVQNIPVGNTLVNVNTPSAAGGPPNTNLAYVAYVLISHGENRGGAFAIGGGAVRTPSVKNGLVGAEAENTNGDLTFVTALRDVENAATYFDDIVLYRTQEQMMRDLGGTGCGQP
jgi:hypothetical protein